LVQYDLDSGGTQTQAAFTMKATDDDLKKKAASGPGEMLAIELLVKNFSGSPTDAGSINVTSAASLSQDALSFDPQDTNTTSVSKTITLTNSVALTDLNFKITGTNASNFKQIVPCGASLAASANCVVTVTFNPTAVGKMTATLAVSYTVAGSQESNSAALTGTGKAPGGALNVTLSSKTLDFGTQRLGTTSNTRSITLVNAGTTPLTSFSAKITGANPISFNETNTCGDSVPVGTKCTFTLKSTGTTVGKFGAKLSISYTTAGMEKSQSVGLAVTISP
jgi:hypothetical protein